ncbi:hypothetical protein I545_0753 [Mycobacterium kansasii 662]|uniref:Uncharacterized protein n=2 Tax=Mycobacterium kansasii TaxID=1768 RepID=A0A1V3XSQ8_MYCKA|nr:hypothetical protein I547_0569 [Mycobacterium kansasii 824]EUA21370.1 hypothetical protein I545_0753 [Mycobacterium kansasii 662]OOK82264.1 hypothetical protein BZL30_1019 [Mycobacterium kansasii]
MRRRRRLARTRSGAWHPHSSALGPQWFIETAATATALGES